MIHYIENSEINYHKWDNCIKQSFNGNIYAMSWYLDIVFGNWSALVEGDYERVMPLMLSKKWGLTYFYQPFFVQQLGVFSRTLLNPLVVNNFIDSIPKRVKIAKFNLNVFNRIEDEKYSFKRNANYELDLISDYKKIYSSYSTNQKRNIKKAFNNKFTFTKGIKPDDIITLFKTNRGKEVLKWGEPQYNTLKRLMYIAIHKGRGITYGVYNNVNELIASAFFIVHNKRIIFLFSGSSRVTQSSGALSYLIDQVIQEYSSSGCILDFEGSNNENLARFYKGFGAKKSFYYTIEINRFNIVFKLLYRIYCFLFSAKD